MKKLFIRIFDFFNTVESKIAFYPTLFAISGFFVAVLMIYLEQHGISREIMDVWPILMVEDGNTALTVLSACLGGLISLMVFSFSMVMLLLSQASNNYSPRLLPGLISDRRHQIILGIYLSTILYNIFILFSIEPSEDKYTLPGFSVLLGIVFTIVCLVAFIYFIHNISQSIQINNILDVIFEYAERRLQGLIESEKGKTKKFSNTDNWYEYKAGRSGYFQNISIKNILKICDDEETKIYITIPKGLFVLKNSIFLKSEKQLDEKVVNSIISNISFARGELVEDNYILAFKQITEIAVKAMSPGINDPGTAINAIDYLTDLFALRMQKNDNGIIIHKENATLRVAVVTFKELMYNVMASLRTYCKHDPVLVEKLLWMMVYLQKQPAAENNYHKVIKEEMTTLLEQAKNSFDSEWDVLTIDKMIAG
ncbi:MULTISPECIES: DUF2254 domain-containing protein [Aequorivita]|uniref:DUF2254 domain-containing protein n=1 Tax=Aequorivita iocasae TaxID=2803865 RepID=A0ABX7DPB0_9FLAO|nr:MULTISPECIES: DUF2254 domain-containing protein [Aequorivita]QQX75627.1 DUF2254 domain-containing protein [Aequorivita iocasae]UCA55083.1 DUF2254 domain-containing protein [Aequorivita sp. F7]